ncbi:867_t:CDS:2, partial [Acaulospora morrowiae]
SIPKRFPFLVKDEDGNVNVHPINNFLIPYDISSSLRKLALRQKINREASDHYGIMNNRLNTPAPMIEQGYDK